MHSPVSTQAFAHLRDDSGPSPVRKMSMMPEMTARGSAFTPPGPVTGQTSTHLPQRVQASAIAATRPANALSKVSVMRPQSTNIRLEYRRTGGELKPRPLHPASLLRDRDALHLEHHFRLREALHRDGGAGGEILAEQLGAQFRHARGVA